MESFLLLVGHLVGDYILQNDWMAKWKAARFIRLTPEEEGRVLAGQWTPSRLLHWRPFAACFSHCLLYTLAIAAFSFWWLPAWGYGVVFAAHFAIDRWRLARLWMDRVSGQAEFAAGPFAPFSVVIVDNTFHLLTLVPFAAARL